MGKNIAVIPAHNEEKTIGSVVKNARKYCDVMVVDDFSTDATAAIAKNNGAMVLKNERNVGYTASLNLGILNATKQAENIIILDADGQHDPDEIIAMLKLLENDEADFVIGVRHQKARAVEKLFGLYGRWVAGVTDPLCGFRAFKSKVYKEIGFYDNIGSIGTQFVFTAKKKGFRIKEIDVKINARHDKPRLFGGNWLRSELIMLRSFIKAVVFHTTGIRLVNPKWK